MKDLSKFRSQTAHIATKGAIRNQLVFIEGNSIFTADYWDRLNQLQKARLIFKHPAIADAFTEVSLKPMWPK